jgi:hypothetical protein
MKSCRTQRDNTPQVLRWQKALVANKLKRRLNDLV